MSESNHYMLMCLFSTELSWVMHHLICLYVYFVLCIDIFFHQKVKGSKDTLNWPVWSKNFLLTMCGHILQIDSVLVSSGLCTDIPHPAVTYRKQRHFANYQLSSRTKNKLFLELKTNCFYCFIFTKKWSGFFCNFYSFSRCKGIQESFSLKTLLSEQSKGIKRPLNVTSWVRGIRLWKAIIYVLFSGNL